MSFKVPNLNFEDYIPANLAKVANLEQAKKEAEILADLATLAKARTQKSESGMTHGMAIINISVRCADCPHFRPAECSPNPTQAWGKCLQGDKGRYGCAMPCDRFSFPERVQETPATGRLGGG